MTITIRAPEPNEIGSLDKPHEFASARTLSSVPLSLQELVQLRSSDLHHVLVDRRIVVHSPFIMRPLEGRSGRVLRIVPIPYSVLLAALGFLHLRSARPADVAAGEVMCAGEMILFDHVEKAFVYHLEVGELEPLLEAAQVLEVQPLVELIQERISFSIQYSRAIIQAVLGKLVDLDQID